MNITSKRFGSLEVPDKKVITMERPVLGFESLRFFCLVEVEELAPFLLMQSTEDPEVAFLVMNPLLFFPEYRIEINSQEIAELDVGDPSTVETYVIMTIAKKPRDITANLQGPILINIENNRGKQLVLVNSNYRVQHSVLQAAEELSRTSSRQRHEELVPA
jgi:flagellar assembly factor FliW